MAGVSAEFGYTSQNRTPLGSNASRTRRISGADRFEYGHSVLTNTRTTALVPGETASGLTSTPARFGTRMSAADPTAVSTTTHHSKTAHRRSMTNSSGGSVIDEGQNARRS